MITMGHWCWPYREQGPCTAWEMMVCAKNLMAAHLNVLHSFLIPLVGMFYIDSQRKHLNRADIILRYLSKKRGKLVMEWMHIWHTKLSQRYVRIRSWWCVCDFQWNFKKVNACVGFSETTCKFNWCRLLKSDGISNYIYTNNIHLMAIFPMNLDLGQPFSLSFLSPFLSGVKFWDLCYGDFFWAGYPSCHSTNSGKTLGTLWH